jgi:hypothetical protein
MEGMVSSLLEKYLEMVQMEQIVAPSRGQTKHYRTEGEPPKGAVPPACPLTNLPKLFLNT